MSREIHYCKCGQSIFGDMTDCGDCPESVDSVVVGVDPGTDKSAFAIFDGREVISHGIYENEHFLSHGLMGSPPCLLRDDRQLRHGCWCVSV
jgi:hypothetical protein